ncbi:MAG: polyhydroxybutyrate depolymerase [Actinomycetota bacterium]|jgi:polyhydroxybutyrate depolymerase|nr:polyhydroxybutyrate depolymerase [Actinomycetota bacterium]
MFLAATVGWLLIAGVSRPVDAAGGSTCTLAPTSGTIMRQVDGRRYAVNVPGGLPGPSAPLLLALHAFIQLPTEHEADTGWSQVASAQHFIVAYPSAELERGAWDFSQGSRDVAYLRDVVRDISNTWCVDRRHVHAEGHSSGALMAARLACDAPDVFASVAVFGGVDPTLLGSPCAPDRPIAIGIFQGLVDPISLFPLAVAHRSNWLLRNGCPLTPATEPKVVVEASVFGPCRAGVEVVWRVYLGGHLWPAGADHADITRRMWEFFMRNPLP